MKVIVCGAGQVGYNIARQLASEHNDVTVIDRSPELITQIGDSLDVQAIVGHASHPDVLELAGAEGADMIIAVTQVDEVNMVACQLAHSLFNVPMKIARVREQSYLEPIWRNLFSRDNMPIDVIISPEFEVARAVIRRLEVPGASDMIPFADDLVRVIAVVVDETCPIIDTPLRQLTELFPELNIRVVGIIRGEQTIVPSADDMMTNGDEVYFAVDTAHVTRAMASFGHEEEEARRIVISGGGNIGLFLAKQIEKEHSDVRVRLIEADKARAEFIADQLSHAVVIFGDTLDREILEEAGVGAAETIVAVTDDDQINILASLLAKRGGCQRAVTLVNSMSYVPLIRSLGIDVVVSPRASTVSTILQHVRRGRIRGLHSLRDGGAEVIEAEVLETSRLAGSSIRQTKLGPGIIIGALVRDKAVIIPRGDTVIQPHDRAILFATAEAVKRVEQLFAVRPDFF